jgi:hypothetical protein
LKIYTICFEGLLRHPTYFDLDSDIVQFQRRETIDCFGLYADRITKEEQARKLALIRFASRPRIWKSEIDNPAGIRMGAYELRKLFDRIPNIQQFVLCWYDEGTLKGRRLLSPQPWRRNANPLDTCPKGLALKNG